MSALNGWNEDVSRTSAAVAASLLLHAGLFALLFTRGVVELTLHPSQTVLLLTAAERTAGPGLLADELRLAPPGSAVPGADRPQQVEQQVEQRVEQRVEQQVEQRVEQRVEKEEKRKEVKPKVEPPPVERPRPDPRPKRDPASTAPPTTRSSENLAAVASPSPPAAPGSTGALANGQNAGSTSTSDDVASLGSGAAGAASAPAWAPAARVRYEELLFAWINRHKQYPLLAQRRGLEGAGAIRIRVDRSGRLLERALVRSTGEPTLDQATLDLVRRASPFPAVPREYPGTSFEFVAPVEYRLR